MLKFLILTAAIFGMTVVGFALLCAFVVALFLIGEFFSFIDRKYGLKGFIAEVIIGCAIISLILATIITIKGT